MEVHTIPANTARRYCVRLVLTLGLLLGSAPAFAVKQDLFALSLEELGNIPITGATLTEKSLRDVPAAVTIFTRSDLRALAVNNLEDLMNRVPGLQAYRGSESSTAYSSSIRGRRVAASNREVLVLLNGMKIDGYYAGGISSTLPLLPLDNIERVEFIRGPGSAVYGSNAYTGVINLVTVRDVNEVALGAGDNQHLEGHWQHSFSTGNLRGATFLQGRDDQGEDYSVQDTLNPQQTTTDDPYSTFNLQQQFFIGDDTRIQLTGAQAKAENYYVLGNIDNGFNQYEFDFAGLMLEQNLYWHDDISSRLALGWKYSRLAPQGTVTPLPNGDKLSIKVDIRSTEYWLDWHNDWQLGHRSSLQFGGEYRHPQIIHAEGHSNYDLAEVVSGTFPLTEYDGFSNRYQVNEKSHADVVGLYSQWQMDWTSRWNTIVGLRYDTYSQIGDNVSPRLGLLFHADRYNTFKLLRGEAFRAPQAGELYTTNNPVLRGNPDLEPETVTTSELIWLHQRERGHLSLNYFYNEFEDAIDQTIVNGVRVYQNMPDTNISDGVEAELQAELMEGLKLLATATWLIKTPDTFFREARDLYSLTGLYDRGKRYGSISGYYRSNRETLVSGGSQRQTLDSYWVVDLKAGYRWTPRLRTEMEVLNLLDKEYFTPTQANRIEDGVPNRRRELRLSALWNY